jgi:hypothetical protein
MLRKRWLSLGALVLLGGVAQAQDKGAPSTLPLAPPPARPALTADTPAKPAPPKVLEGKPAPGNPDGAIAVESGGAPVGGVPPEDAPAASEEKYGPTPLGDVKILQELLFGKQEKPCLNVSGWLDMDYTYRSTGHGITPIAPVENRFGDEFLLREIGLFVSKPLDPKTWSWGFNAIYIGGADASFIQPTAGWPKQTNPRFGEDFTDLNLTAHLPILTEGGVDVKAGRQTTILGPMGALAWQRYFDSSDYAWYNLEEGRYTGVSTVWHVNKRLDWYNGVEIGGWGVFFDTPNHGVDYIGNISYWLDEDAKKAKVWTTVLTGPTGFTNGASPGGNTTTWEVGLQVNWTSRIYQIIDHQGTYSKAPLGLPGSIPASELPVRPGYQERAYDVYTYLGAHLTKTVDLNSRFEWYKDVDGGGYPGGFGVPHTDYYAITVGPDYHPTKWVQFRPEIRYDHATHDNFGEFHDKKDQLSIAADVLLKF